MISVPTLDIAPGEDVDPLPHRAGPDLELVAVIVRRAGLDCRTDGDPRGHLRARRTDRGPGSWSVIAGRCPAPTQGAFVGPVGGSWTWQLRDTDERRLAALVVLQALRDDPTEPFTHDEATACGLADGLVRSVPGTVDP